MFVIITSLIVSNNILRRAFEEGIKVSPMKLQKLLYLLYARYLYETKGIPLFSSRFEVWQYGPVLPEIYFHFREFKAEPIDKYALVGNETLAVKENNEVFKKAIDLVWKRYKYKTENSLSELTHKQDTAWYKADSRNERFLLDDEIIEDGEFFFES